MTRALLSAALFALTAGCVPSIAGGDPSDVPSPAEPVADGQAEAIFATGCFWCSEYDFEKVPGVIDAVSGYAGGATQDPTYTQVSSGATGHTEALRVIYDPQKVSYGDLLDHFWTHVDPFDGSGQFCDRGSQYRPAILPVDSTQRAAAQKSLKAFEERAGRSVALKIEDPGTFWVAESYHQDFYKKNPAHYKRYRTGCGRDKRIQAIQAKLGEPKPKTQAD